MIPSRRDALRMGVAGLVGAAGLSATTQPADAATGSAGDIGDPNNRPDVFADTVDANQVTGATQGCRVFLSSQQSIAQGNRAKIQFDSEVYDSDNNFDTGTHNWTCPKDGLYAVNLQVRFGGGGSGQGRTIVIGTATDAFPNNEGAFNQQNSSDTGDSISVSTINRYISGDTIAGYVKNSNSNDSLQDSSFNNKTFLEVAFLGGL